MEDKEKLLRPEETSELSEEQKQNIETDIEALKTRARELKKIADEELKSENYERATNSYTEAIINIKNIKKYKYLSESDLNELIKEIVIPSNLNLSLIDLKLNDWDNLINHSSKVLFADKDNKKAKYRRCVGYINKQEFEKAQNDFEELKQQIGVSTEIKILEDMLIKKKKNSGEEFYKKMSKQLHKTNTFKDDNNKSTFHKIKDFLFNRIFCCCFKKRKNKGIINKSI